MSSNTPPPKPAISRAEWGLLLLLTSIQFTNILDFVIIMPIAPWAKEKYGITSEQFGHVIAAYGFASFVGSILSAKFLDRFDRKPALLTVYLGFTLSTLMCGLAPTYETLVAARAITGLFGGVVGAAVMAIIGDVFADYRRGTAMGAVMSSFAVASIAGLPIGLVLVETMGTGAPFVGLAVVSTVVWLGVFRVLPHIHASEERLRHRASLWKLATEPNHVTAFLFSIALVLGSFTVVPYLADSMVANVGQKRESMKYLYPVAGGFTLISTNLFGRLADRYGKRFLFRVLGSMAILLALVLTNLPPVPLWVAIAASTAFMIATSGRMVPAQAMITASAAPHVRGGFLSLNAAVQSAAMGAASLVGGILINQNPNTGRLDGYPMVGLLAAATAVLSLVLAGLLRNAEAGPVRVPTQGEADYAEPAT